MSSRINLFEAVRRMRRLTELGVPFEFTFLSYNGTSCTTNGIKTVYKSQLRKGYRDDQSEKASILIGYVNEHGSNRWFYLPLLVSFNGYIIQP